MKCAFCSNQILIHKKYCSKECYFKHKNQKTISLIICSFCHKSFERKNHKIKQKNYCSKTCSNTVNRQYYTVTEEHRKKISNTAKKLGYGKWMAGRKGNSGSFKKGQFSKEKHPFWKGGITPENQRIRLSENYKKWRESVFIRDNYRCQWCGIRGIKIHADHIKPFSIHKKDRFKLSNGRTLCESCHKKRTGVQLSVIWRNQFTSPKTQ